MRCNKCKGTLVLDRTYEDNLDFEIFCLICGFRAWIKKNTFLGQWISAQEKLRKKARVL